MAVLKYKNGSDWVTLDFSSGDSLDNYPVQSLYLSNRIFIYSDVPGSGTGQVLGLGSSTTSNVIASPASFLGGTWAQLKAVNLNVQGFSLTMYGSYGNNYYPSATKGSSAWSFGGLSGTADQQRASQSVMFTMWQRTA